jgi:hypothetical protein
MLSTYLVLRWFDRIDESCKIQNIEILIHLQIFCEGYTLNTSLLKKSNVHCDLVVNHITYIHTNFVVWGVFMSPADIKHKTKNHKMLKSSKRSFKQIIIR